MNENSPVTNFMSFRFGVVIPCYREEETIGPLIREIRRLYTQAEIVVVDDSPDSLTVEAVTKIQDPLVHLIHRQGKGGRGTAVLEGLAWLREHQHQVFFEMDADFSHPPTLMAQMMEKANREQLDVIVGSRYVPGGEIHNWPLSRRIFSLASNWLARFLLEVPIRDYTSGYRFYSARACDVILKSCGRLGTGFIALSEFLVQTYYSGLKVGEVPLKFVNRVRGESSFSIHEIINAARGIFRIAGLKKELTKT